MKKLLVVLLIGLLTIGLLVTGCGNKTETTPPVQEEADGPGVTAREVKIGAWLPLTGPAAIHGTYLGNGSNAYYNMVNDNGGVNGRMIKLLVEDTDRDPQKTVAGARKLVERDEIFAIVGPFGNAQSAATFEYLLEEQKVPLLNVYGGQTVWYDPPKPYLYGSMVVYEDQNYALGRWMAKEGAENILIVHNDPAAYEQVAQHFEPGIKSFNPNATVNFMSVKLNTSDYVPIALQVIQAKPDAIGWVGPHDELVLLARELARQNVKIPMYSYAPNASLEIIKLGGTAIEGLRSVTWTLPPTADTPEVEEYRTALKQYFPYAEPEFNSLFAWAEAKIFVEALSRVQGPLTRDNFIAALETLDNYETGILPPATFSATKHLGISGLQPVMLVNGEWQTQGDFVDPRSDW